jgi:glycosyltransferase involved in cell wall biosynthesis
MNPSSEAITIIMTGRDRFSLTEDCIEHLKAHTPQPFHLIVVLGGAPKEFENRLRERYGKTATLVFEPRFLNCSEARNVGLKLAKTRLSVCMDNDVFPRPGWLPPLLRCENETSAGLVVPLILEDNTHIHCAGNDMFITKRGARSFVSKVLPYRHMPVSEGTNIKRREIDYGEMHLQLIDTQAALALGVYDERIQEGEELDCGLVWRKAGRSIWFEPESIVVYDFPRRIEHPGDIAFFCWRWNAANLIPGYKTMHEKWGMDMTEAGYFKFFLLDMNARVGWLPRLWHSRRALAIDRVMDRALAILAVPNKARMHLYAWGTGNYEWAEQLEGAQPASHRIVSKVLSIFGVGSNGRREVERLQVQDDVYVDVFHLQEGTIRGPGASILAKGEEVLRIACLGYGRGYYQVYPRQLKRWDIPRHYFKETTVDAQIDSAVRLLERDGQDLLRAGPVSTLQEITLDAGRLTQVCRDLSEKLRAYVH